MIRRKIGIFGGRFDPIHMGHLIVAQDVAEKVGLDLIVFLVSFHPPHKTEFTPFQHRFRMAQLATMGNPSFVASDFERRLNLAKSYTVLVMEKLRDEFRNSDLYFLMGMDQFLTMESSWHKPERLFELAKVIVMQRPPIQNTAFAYSRFSEKAIFVKQRLVEVSSTEIRERVRRGLSIKYLVPPQVERYIYEHKLYGARR